MKIKKVKRKKRMNEKLKVSDGLKVWIQDFLDSSAPQFKGKSPKERIKMEETIAGLKTEKEVFTFFYFGNIRLP